ncbi:MAG: hypothetical protein NZL83_01875 [Candidatus Absconditabacterales bacterium]|nr:hypothetical protein [Candidatus Absconditabacterales bacterium]
MTQSSSSSTLHVIIAVLVVIILAMTGGFIYMIQSFPSDDTPQESQKKTYRIDQRVTFTGTIVRSVYPQFTFGFENEAGEYFGVRSRLFSLNTFLGRRVIIDATVSDIVGDFYLLTIIAIREEPTAPLAEEPTQSTGALLSMRMVYDAGLFFSHSQGRTFRLDQVAQSLTITDETGKDILFISYFLCAQQSASNSCAGLQRSFSSISTSRLTASDGTQVIPVPDSNRFFMTNETWGRYLTPAENVAMATLLPHLAPFGEEAVRLILGQDPRRTECPIQLSRATIGLTFSDTMVVRIQGTGDKTIVSCTTRLMDDGTALMREPFIITQTPLPSQSSLFTGTTLPTNTGTVSTQTPSSPITGSFPVQSSLIKDETVRQIPVMTTGLTFTARAGFTMVIPTMRAQFAGEAIDDDRGIEGLRCRSKTAIAAFDRTDEWTETPSITHYLCTYRETLLDQLAQDYRVLPFPDQKHMHLIQINDPARYDIAFGITISYPEAE